MSIWYNLELVPPRLKDADDRREIAKFTAALTEKFAQTPYQTVSTTSGTAGGWTMANDRFFIGEGGTYIGLIPGTGIQVGHETFASAPFSVTNAGVLKATSGVIGGWTLSSDRLSGGSGGNYVGLIAGTGIQVGNETFGDAPFSITKAGVLKAISGTIGGWTLAASTISSTNIIIDSGNELIKTNDFVSGALGKGWCINNATAEFNNIRARGKITTAVFEKETISSIGGNLQVSDSDILNADMTALDASTLTILGDTTFAVNDILRIKDGVSDEWLLVTNIASAPTYTVTRDQAGDYAANTNPIWKKGTAVINYGASGQGLIYMTASESNAPYLSVVTHAGSPWSVLTTRLRLGNLNGFLGYSSDLYGLAIGEATKYLKYDPTNGLRIRGAIDADSGTIGTLTVDGTLTIGTGGDIRSNDYVANTTGFLLHPSTGLEVNTGSVKGALLDTGSITAIETATATNQSTNSATYSTLITDQITTPASTKLLILFQASDLKFAQMGFGESAQFRIKIGAVEKTGILVGGGTWLDSVTGEGIYSENERVPVELHHWESVGAGTHTITVEWKSVAGSDGQKYIYAGYDFAVKLSLMQNKK